MSYDLQAEGINGVNQQTTVGALQGFPSQFNLSVWNVDATAAPAIDAIHGITSKGAAGVVGTSDTGVGVKGTCQGPEGDGVQGFGGDAGSNDVAGGNGVMGQGGAGTLSVVGGIGVLGRGGNRGNGKPHGPGVVGIDGNHDLPVDRNKTRETGVFGLGHTGVVGVDDLSVPPDVSERRLVGVYGAGVTGVKGSSGELASVGVWGHSDYWHGVFADNSDSLFQTSGVPPFLRPAGLYGVTLKNRSVAGVVGVEGKLNDPKTIDPWAIGVYGSSAPVPKKDPPAWGGWAGFFVGPVGIYGGLAVAGYKSAAVPHPDGSHRLLYSIESPESWFEDFGEARLFKGKADVKLEKEFAKVVRTDSYHVFLTPCGDSKGLYIATRNSRGFTVKEQQGGKSTVNFAYRIVARRKDIDTPRLAKIELPKIQRPTTSAKSRKKRKA